MQKYGHLANQEQELSCVVCGGSEWSWTDYHGEAYCVDCGTPHQLKGGQDGRRGCNMTETFVVIIKEYWEKTKKGCGMGTFMIERDYPDQLEDKRAFISWLKENHPEVFKDKDEA